MRKEFIESEIIEYGFIGLILVIWLSSVNFFDIKKNTCGMYFNTLVIVLW